MSSLNTEKRISWEYSCSNVYRRHIRYFTSSAIFPSWSKAILQSGYNDGFENMLLAFHIIQRKVIQASERLCWSCGITQFRDLGHIGQGEGKGHK
jgi:hypothetical protein